jgi:hypothetical protein
MTNQTTSRWWVLVTVATLVGLLILVVYVNK